MKALGKSSGLAIAIATVLSGACGGGPTASGKGVNNSSDGKTSILERRIEGQEKQIAELEVRLALLEASANEFRALIEAGRPSRRETIRIGAHKESEPVAEERFKEKEREADNGRPRPLIRLYGKAPENAPASALLLPPGALDRLPVAPLPEEDGSKLSVSLVGSQALPAGETAVITEYRNALSLLRTGKFDQAQQAFLAFTTSYPGHAYADNALYWCGEALYAKKDYPAALRQFEEVAERYPASRKLPDLLLKIGLCHRRMGNAEKARVYFRRVLRRYPDSTAARLASREDA